MDFSVQAKQIISLSKRMVLGSLAVLCLAISLQAGVGGFGRRSVGGVVIDAGGVVRDATIDEKQAFANLLSHQIDRAAGELEQAAPLRMISIKGLQQAIIDADTAGRPLPSDIKFLAGLQQIDYVFVDADQNDIVIAGPAEPWEIRPDGHVVGKVTGGAVMHLSDLVVAIRGVEQAARDSISCSIEPTAEGRRKLNQLLSRVKLRPGQTPAGLEGAMKQAFGPQMIHLTGVPEDSRYARTMVAADFEMKRVAMGLVEKPLDILPSYIQMSRNSSRANNQNPRWWMACDYDDLARSEDGLAWKLSGNRVKTLTEQDIIGNDGTAKASGKTDKIAKAWAEKMNENFAALSAKMPIFSELQNLMDMTVVATLIRQENLAAKAGLDLSVLQQVGGPVDVPAYEVPRSVAPQCSFVRGAKGWVVSASGGVDINAFDVVAQQQVQPEVQPVAAGALDSRAPSRWWWNGDKGSAKLN